MRDRYYYDARGRYRGRSSDQGPYDWTGLLVLAVILLLVLRGC